MAVKQNDIRIGSRDNPFLALNNSDIITVGGNLACDLLCEEIPIDTLEIQCRYDRMHRVFAPSDYGGLQSSDGLSFRSRESAAGSVMDIPYATGLWYFNDDQYIGKFYVSDSRRTGKNVYTITAVSAMGVLDRLPYYGKLFLNHPLSDVLNDITLTDGLRDTNTPFLTDLNASIVLSDGLDTVKVSGWIPNCTKREALHHVLFAQGLNIFKAENDAFLISRISSSSVGGIDPKNVYDSGSVDLTDRVKVIEVTEHAFVPNPNAEDVVLYDNTEAAVDMEATVPFDAAPIMVNTITATGTIKIKQKNENCAVVSGVGTLTGKPYSHTSHTIARTNNSVIDGETITVSDATLVNSLNSDAVSDRLFAYYTQRKQMQMPIVLSGERCGMKYGCMSPYGDAIDAYIAAMTINASAIAKADCRMISGYVPPKGSGEFSHVVLLTGSGTFTVPEDVFNADNPRIRVVLVGGGDGGWSGDKGEDGPDKPVETIDKLAKPGKPGKNGNSGKIAVFQKEGAEIKSTYEYSCGDGGDGGTTSYYGDSYSRPGDAGCPSIFGSLSSSVGAVLDGGYLDILSGNVYGGPSPDYSWVLGGIGGGFIEEFDAESGTAEDGSLLLPEEGVEYKKRVHIEPQDGFFVVNSAVSNSIGRPIGTVMQKHGSEGPTVAKINGADTELYGGAGSGGPVFNRWLTGEDSEFIMLGDPYIQLGDGANGDVGLEGPCPIEINQLAYGQGGIGGMGGCAGGSAGVVVRTHHDLSNWKVYEGSGGTGGLGGRGGKGAPGCILVYY